MITKEEALEAIEDMDDFARMANIEPIGAYKVLKQFVEDHYQDSLRYKKIKELGLDIGVYYPTYQYCSSAWFEYYGETDIDQIIETEEYSNANLCN